MIYTNELERRNQTEGALELLEIANQVATKINNEYKNIHAHADTKAYGRVVIFANDYAKKVTVPYSFFTPAFKVSFSEQLQECLDVINYTKEETNKIKRI